MSSMFEISPEALAALQERRNHERMHMEDAIHQSREFYDSLTKDQLVHLNGLVAGCADEHVNYYQRGLIDQLLDTKFNVCLCGTDHSDASSFIPDLDDIETYDDECSKYGVTDKGDASGIVVCDGCGIENRSLQDRMLREPGLAGCTGCQHKSAHG